jgi:hypothetical protein
MDINKALLSQGEVDVLIKFLSEKKDEVTDEVLNQSSVDKLLRILTASNGDQILYFDSVVPSNESRNAILLLDSEHTAVDQGRECTLIARVDEATDFIELVCVNTVKNKEYVVTPHTLENVRYDRGDKAVWGKTVPPKTFDTMAALLHVGYSKQTFDMVVERFAEVLYGNAKASIPAIYMPTTNELLTHLKT